MTHGLRDDAHGLGVLVGEQSEESGEGAQARREEDEERQLLLRVDGHVVERCDQRSATALTRGTCRRCSRNTWKHVGIGAWNMSASACGTCKRRLNEHVSVASWNM